MTYRAQQLDATSQAVIAADEWQVRAARGTAQLDRRGLLKRLARRSSTNRFFGSTSISHAVRDGVARATAVVGLAGVALIHVLDAPGAFQDAPYKGWLYTALILGSMVAAGALIRGSDGRAWVAAAVLPFGAIVAYVISRTVGLPQGADDIGNWSEPLGMASLFVEGSLVGLSAMMLRDNVRVLTAVRAWGPAPRVCHANLVRRWRFDR